MKRGSIYLVAIFASECSMCSQQYPTLVCQKKWSNNRNSAYYRRDKLKTQILKLTASCLILITRLLFQHSLEGSSLACWMSSFFISMHMFYTSNLTISKANLVKEDSVSKEQKREDQTYSCI